MSWCRFGSKCEDTIVYSDVDSACPRATCPGSDLYVFDSGDGFECCACRLNGHRAFVVATEAEMLVHLLAHVEAGDHVRLSLIEWAIDEVPLNGSAHGGLGHNPARAGEDCAVCDLLDHKAS